MQFPDYDDRSFPWVVAVVVAVVTVAFLQASKWCSSKIFEKVQDFWTRGKVTKLAKVFVLNDPNESNQILQAYREFYPFPLNFLGLDCEWVNEKEKGANPVALLQLATPFNDCFLIRLCQMKGSLPTILKEILEDRNILKFGVGIQDDAKKLNVTHGLNVSGCVDLRHVVLRCQSHTDISADERSKGSSKMGLGALCKRYLGVEMEKSWRVRCSNWEAEELSVQQIEYAAHDAIVAVHLFLTLAKLKQKEHVFSDCLEYFKDTNEEKCYSRSSSKATFDTNFSNHKHPGIAMSLNKYETDTKKGHIVNSTEILTDGVFCQRAVSLCQGIIDLGFKDKFMKSTRPVRNEKSVKTEIIKKPSRPNTLRKSPLYTKCQLLAPDGAMLCTLDRKKAEWYLDKDIGELVSEDPFTVKLKFEPSSRPDKCDSYYLTFKENMCVVCGETESYSRKSIVPHEYRKYFPECMKDHQSHDVVLMCPPCHGLTTIYDDELRQKLAREYKAPLGNKEFSKFIQDPERMKVKSAAKALLSAADKIPSARKETLTHVLQQYYGDVELTPLLLNDASTMDVLKENLDFTSHGEVVIRRVKEQKKLLEFEKMWRVHFVETMHPEHLPDLWCVDHRLDRLKDALARINLQ